MKRRVVLGNYLMKKYSEKEQASNMINAMRFKRMIIEQYTKEMAAHDIDFVISPTGFGEKPPKV